MNVIKKKLCTILSENLNKIKSILHIMANDHWPQATMQISCQLVHYYKRIVFSVYFNLRYKIINFIKYIIKIICTVL